MQATGDQEINLSDRGNEVLPTGDCGDQDLTGYFHSTVIGQMVKKFRNDALIVPEDDQTMTTNEPRLIRSVITCAIWWM